MPSKTYTTYCIMACMKHSDFGRGATRQQIKAFIAAMNGGKCSAHAVNKALRNSASFVHGKSTHRFKATDAAVATTKKR